MVSQDDIIDKSRELKPELYKEFCVKNNGLFGSFSNENYSEESDIDLLVELEKPIGWKFVSLEIYLEKIFKRKVDLVTRKTLKSQLRDQILNQVKYI